MKPITGRFLPAIIIIVGTLAIFLSFAVKGLHNTPDSVAYLNTAENFANGKGLVVSVTNRNVKTGDKIVPQKRVWLYSSWPPFYPMLVSIPIKFGFSKFTSAIIIQTIFLGILLASLFFLVYQLKDGTTATLALLAFAGMYSVYFIASRAWTEITFTAFGVAALAFLIRYDQRSQFKFLIIAGLATGLAALTRMNGIAIWAAALIFLFMQRRSMNEFLRAAAIYSVLSLTPLAIWLARTIYLTGHMTGIKRAPSEVGFWQNALQGYDVLRSDLLTPYLSYSFLTSRLAPFFGKLAILAILLALAGILFDGNIKQRLDKAKLPLMTALLLFVYVVTGSSMLKLASFDIRYIMPLYPFLIAGFAAMASDLKITKRIFFAGLVLLFVSQAFFSYKFVKFSRGLASPVAEKDWHQILKKAPENAAIYSNRFDLITLFVRPSFRVPIKNPQHIKAFLGDGHDVGDYLVIVPNARPYLASVELTEDPSLYKTLYETDAVQIYKFVK